MTPDWAEEFYRRTGVGVLHVRTLEPWEAPGPERDAAISELVHGKDARRMTMDELHYTAEAVEALAESTRPHLTAYTGRLRWNAATGKLEQEVCYLYSALDERALPNEWQEVPTVDPADDLPDAD